MTSDGVEDESELYQRPDGTPKATGRELFESVATVRVDDTQAPNGRVAIHVEHPDHDRGVRCFFRSRESAPVASCIKSHLRTEIDADLARVEVIDEADLGLAEADLMPRKMERERPGSPAVGLEVMADV